MPTFDLNVNHKDRAVGQVGGVRSHHLISLLAIAGAFACSRVFYYYQGIRFDDRTIMYAWQFLDPVLLRRDLLWSVLHLHTQPPLFNLFLGAVIKTCGVHSASCFAMIYALMGLVICFSMFSILTGLGTSPVLSVAVTLLFALSPPAILYENWLFYTYPLIMLLCLAVVALQRFLRVKSYASCFTFFLLLAAIVLLRSGFHLAWFIFVCIIFVVFLKDYRRKILICCMIPLCLCGAWYLKNLMLFGSFTGSSLLGMNLARKTIVRMSPSELTSLAKQGQISPLALIGPFKKVPAYKPYVRNMEKTSVPALDNEVKSTGAENFNHLAYLQVSKQLFDDSIKLILLHPGRYVASIEEALSFFFRPASDYGILDVNRHKVPEIEEFYNKIICCQLGDEGIALTLLALFLIALAGGGWIVVKGLFGKSVDLELSMPILFMWITIAYVTVAFNSIEIFENQRFRFLIEPYVLLITGTLLGRLLRRKPGTKSSQGE